MSYTGLTKIGVLDKNSVLQDGVTWTHSGFTEASWHPTENLDNDSPLSTLKSATITGTPRVVADFGGGTTPTITTFGICNHNLVTAGWSTIYLWYSDTSATGPWTQIGSPNYYTLAGGDRDIILFFTESLYRYYSFTIGGSGGNFYIGYVYWGIAHQLDTQPLDALMIQTRSPNVQFVESAGGGVHAVRMNSYRKGELTLSFSRASADDLDRWLTVSNRIVAVYPPEYSTYSLSAPNGQDVFYGWVTRVDSTLRSPGSVAAGTNVYDITVTLKGAV